MRGGGRISLDRCQYVSHEGEFSFTGASCDGNCTIYKTRPQVCRDFVCGYIKGETDRRPDELGKAFLETGFASKPFPWSIKGED
jgi:Fe-S-cluster containining protein